MSSYYTAHSAYLQGLPAYKAIPLARQRSYCSPSPYTVFYSLAYAAWLRMREPITKNMQQPVGQTEAEKALSLNESKRLTLDHKLTLQDTELQDARGWAAGEAREALAGKKQQMKELERA